MARKTGGRVLILTPLAVSFQTIKEGVKIGVEVAHRREGIQAGDRIVVTNYERLHYFNAEDFDGVVCDESSILKNYDGETRKAITDFMFKTPYRLLCTATAAPNDYVELGTASEALGELKYREMLARFFNHDGGETSKWRLKKHANAHAFWGWMCSWARACRKPSDLGFDDASFVLPPLSIRDHVVSAKNALPGYLFDLPAVGLDEQRTDLRRTINERCEMAATLINGHKNPALAWCNLNEEGDRMTRLIPGAVQVSGNDSDEFKEESFLGFINGEIRVIVTKPTIAGLGLNFQHCAHQTFFPSHSYEQFYQATRRSWRFGQKNPVTIDMITTDGQTGVKDNLKRKAAAADRMFETLVSIMWKELKIEKRNEYTTKEESVPWL